MLLFFCTTLIYTTILSGWALSVLWKWFIAPVLGLPILSIPEAIGLAMVASYMTHQYIKADDGEGWELIARSLLYVTIKAAVALVAGWLVHQFM